MHLAFGVHLRVRFAVTFEDCQAGKRGDFAHHVVVLFFAFRHHLTHANWLEANLVPRHYESADSQVESHSLSNEGLAVHVVANHYLHELVAQHIEVLLHISL